MDNIKNIIFKDNIDEYNKLLEFHNRKKELLNLKELCNKTPYVIEFTGTPRTGKTTLINNIYDFFKKGGFDVKIIEEFTTSKKYKEEIYPLFKNNEKKYINFEIPKYVLNQLIEQINNNPDIIIVDRCLFDRLIWVDRLYKKEGINSIEYDEYKNIYLPNIKDKINIIIATYADAIVSLKRDYMANLSLEERRFLNEQNISEYNEALLNMKELSIKENINLSLFNTNDKTQREISFEVIDNILNDMKSFYLEKNKIKKR